jgi:hypothetical protein
MTTMGERPKAKGKRRKLVILQNPRDLTYLKPPKFKDHLTISELSIETRRTISWLRKLEQDGRIPQAARVQRGELEVRLWSPKQVEEIKRILATLRPGRKPGT